MEKIASTSPAAPSRCPICDFVALTAAPERAVEYGIDETRVLPFAESVGGRYSLWSTIGFPAAPLPPGAK